MALIKINTRSATAPSNPSEGQVWFNTSSSTVSGIKSKSSGIYNGSFWDDMSDGTNFNATGGSEAIIGGYKIHTFFTSGTFTTNKAGTVDYLVIGGGGGGGNDHGGGGGGGRGFQASGNNVGGHGGIGLSNSYSGVSRRYAGGGGGNGYQDRGGMGGNSAVVGQDSYGAGYGGQYGGTDPYIGTSGDANTGSGGGGSAHNGSSQNKGMPGGSGIVIIRYAL